MAEYHPSARPWRIQDLSGKTFGFLTVLHFLGVRGRNRYWRCVCVCGKELDTDYGRLVKNPHNTSCGCKSKLRKHTCESGLHRDLLGIWLGMKSRCYNPDDANYRNYGGRGIAVCDRWLNGEGGKSGFDCFVIDMHPRPTNRSLDRRDNNGSYSPDNCRWSNAVEQATNKRTNVLLTYNGETHCIAEWSRITGIKTVTLHRRHRVGWSAEEILKPVRAKVEKN